MPLLVPRPPLRLAKSAVWTTMTIIAGVCGTRCSSTLSWLAVIRPTWIPAHRLRILQPTTLPALPSWWTLREKGRWKMKTKMASLNDLITTITITPSTIIITMPVNIHVFLYNMKKKIISLILFECSSEVCKFHAV